MNVDIEDVNVALARDGYFVGRVEWDDAHADLALVETARAVGDLFVPEGCEAAVPVIRTAPTLVAAAAPFDRPEPIGWHGDFATHENRPEVSLVYVKRADRKSGCFGAWRLACVARVVEAMAASSEGRAALDLLSAERVPFSYRDGEPPRWFFVVQTGSDARTGFRFYLPSIRRGCLAAFGEMPTRLGSALDGLERAADEVGEVVPTVRGSLLVASNWLALHDRMEQTVDGGGGDREALLCFVGRSREDEFLSDR